MAESKPKPGIFASAQKRISRTKTKVLQNLGVAERTTDDTFTTYVRNIEKQQEVAHHLQKELKNYVHCVRDLNQASKHLQAVLLSTYESDWTEEDAFKQQIMAMELLWNNYVENLQDCALTPLHNYLVSFPVLKNKIAKRGRKLVDFDNARHHLDSLQAAKKKDEVKIQKAQDDLQDAKKIYEDLNNELHTELPDFYNSRVSFYAGLFSSMFGAGHTFHNELGKTNRGLEDISGQLTQDYASYVYHPKRPLSKSLSSSSENALNGELSGTSAPSTPGVTTPSSTLASPASPPGSAGFKDSSQVEYSVPGTSTPSSPNGLTNGESKASDKPAESTSSPAETKANNVPSSDDNNLYEEPREPIKPPAAAKRTEPATGGGDNSSSNSSDDDDENKDKTDGKKESNVKLEYVDDAQTYSSPPSNKPITEPPSGMLYTVQSTHKYAGEDIDELTFDPGEIIYVIPFENPDEQDDGWQMGIKQSDGKKGVFPENFTVRV